MKTFKRKSGKFNPETIIVRNGYEYHLVPVERPKGNFEKVPDPCFMGYPGMALKSCKKIKIKKS